MRLEPRDGVVIIAVPRALDLALEMKVALDDDLAERARDEAAAEDDGGVLELGEAKLLEANKLLKRGADGRFDRNYGV